MELDGDTLNSYKDHFVRINEELERSLVSRVPFIQDIGTHTLLGRGKRLRPLLFVLSSSLCNYQGEDMYRLSTIFEIVHSASLLHDDVLDNADVRRKKPSANYLWGNHAAVLEGDFLSSRAFSIAVGSNNLAFLDMITDCTTRMAEGQIMELIHTDDWDTTRQEYMEIITDKTAVLISAACACGAIISGAEEGARERLANFGLNMGIAFQLTDDVLDYTSSEEVFGKPVGKDIRERKITLPLIYYLSTQDASEKERLERLFKGRDPVESDYRDLIGLVRGKGVLDRIWHEAESRVAEAMDCLRPFPDSPVKQSLLELSRYAIEREY